MEGLEGLKILSESIRDSTEEFWVMVAFIGTIIFILAIIGYIEEQKSCFISVIIILILAIPLGFDILNEPSVKQLKVTPIEDKYYIDLNKWNIINTESEIITIEEKVK